jgi:murein DD-endopeptidase MepM/ murein hydrolase activator NlpD
VSYVRAESPIGRYPVIPGGEFGADRGWVGGGSPPIHTGCDFAMPIGTSLPAFIAGTVLRASWGDSLSGYIVKVRREDGLSVTQAHLDRVLVQAGDRVESDRRVALSGNTGSATTGPHLHLEVCRDDRAHASLTDCYRAGTLVDPLIALRREEMTDEELLAALKRIYAGPSGLEELVKPTIREMLRKDPETRELTATIAAHRIDHVVRPGV